MTTVRASLVAAVALVGVAAFAAPSDPEFPPAYRQPDLDRMIQVPAGIYPVGDHAGVGFGSEGDGKYTVRLKAFAIAAYPVTNRQYNAYVKAGARDARTFTSHPELMRPLQPVVGIAFADADAYCRSTGMRLPTEWEWEIAARAGDARTYPWGNEEPSAGGVWRANLGDGRATVYKVEPYGEDGFFLTAPVGAYPSGANPWGLHDMAGNVWQWTSTPFQFFVFRQWRDGELPPLEPPADFNTVRGGGWTSSAWSARSTARRPLPLTAQQPDLGFRCARD